ncbi:MAG: efflux RND transporter periplasmic adaptor subunit, partial [Bacteroidota bacterium]|nr:efflux RND transporter periplasmic adaptor subunit [Bacteroidota bacterium]
MRDAEAVPAVAQSEIQPLSELIERENKRQANRRLRRRIGLIALPFVLAALWFFVLAPKPVPMAMRFRMSHLSTGDIVREVRATGEVEAVTTVQVGAEVSGRLASVQVDFNDRVKKGQVLARFDLTLLQAEYNQAATAATAAVSARNQAKTNRDKSKLDFDRTKKLYDQKLLAQSDYDAAVAIMRNADESVDAAEAQLLSLKAAATVARTNLKHGTIFAPIDGIIITRNIDSGQTLASVFQTPILFSVAADLEKMQVIAAVDEADIGELKEGQHATFTVNAYPDRVFEC